MGLTNMTYTDDSVLVSVTWRGALTTAFVYHNLTGIYAKGHAKHFEEDQYSQTVGSDLAVARAKSRLYSKISKHIAKNPIESIEDVI